METGIIILAGLAGLGALILALGAAALLATSAEERDLSTHLRDVVRPPDRNFANVTAPTGASGWTVPFRRIGDSVRNTALINEKDIAEFERAVAAAGLDPRNAVPTFIGVKVTVLLLLPALAYGYSVVADLDAAKTAIAVFGAILLGVMGPNWAIALMKRPFHNKLRKGLPDAMDLLVVCAEAGLGLETAVERVSKEMEASNRPIALEFNILVQELRMLPDRRMALERMGERTEIDGFKRLGGTLSQTLRYGTPLAQALRTLATEMRTDRMLKLEEKAVRLPALLVIPLILFILPSLFIALIGHSVIALGTQLG